MALYYRYLLLVVHIYSCTSIPAGLSIWRSDGHADVICGVMKCTRYRLAFGFLRTSPMLHRPQIQKKKIETGRWSKSAPHNPFESFSTLHSFAGTVLPTEASDWHTTLGWSQPSHYIVWSVVGLAFVLLEWEIPVRHDHVIDPLHQPPLRKL